MPELRAHLRSKRIPVPQVKITRLQIAVTTVLRLGYAAALGAAVCMVCSIGKTLATGTFGKSLLWGIWTGLTNGIATLLPLSLASFASLIALAIPLSIVGLTLFTAWWTDTLTPKNVAPDQEAPAQYAFICWALPMTAFALSLSTGLLSLSSAYWLTFALGTASSSWWVAIQPALQEFGLWKAQQKWFADFAAQNAQTHSRPAPAPQAPTVRLSASHTPLFDVHRQAQRALPAPPPLPPIRIGDDPEPPRPM